MKRNFNRTYNSTTTSNDDRFGFTSATNVLNNEEHNPVTRPDKPKTVSKTWDSFFQQMNEEENTTSKIMLKTKFNPPEFSKSRTIENLNEVSKNASIFQRLMGENDCNNPIQFSANQSSCAPNDSVIQQHQMSDPIEEELYSVFTKKASKSSAVTTVLDPVKALPLDSAMYMPPKFTSSVPLAKRAFNLIANNTALFNGKPYVLPSNPLPKKMAPRLSETSKPLPTIPNRRLPENLASRQVLVFTVLYSPSSTRKHKKWENDGFLYYDFTDNQLCLTKALDKQPIARHPTPRLDAIQIAEEYVPGFQTFIGGYEVQVQDDIFSNINMDYIKEEKYSECDDYDDAVRKKSRIEDDKHFFDEQMENYLVKTEENLHEPLGFGLFSDEQSANASQDSNLLATEENIATVDFEKPLDTNCSNTVIIKEEAKDLSENGNTLQKDVELEIPEPKNNALSTDEIKAKVNDVE